MMDESQRDELVKAAIEARQSAYAPYSSYPVGAALLTSTGMVYTGNNIENAAYPLSICAERVAAFKAVSIEDREFEAIAVVTRDGGSPCGSCRQVLSEFGMQAIVYIADEKGNVIEETTVAELIPGAFGPGNLEK
jgi:cytidine deaminase